jgi:hypothetical protein
MGLLQSLQISKKRVTYAWWVMYYYDPYIEKSSHENYLIAPMHLILSTPRLKSKNILPSFLNIQLIWKNMEIKKVNYDIKFIDN